MKKIMAFLLSAMMVFALLAGCGGDKDTGSNGTPEPENSSNVQAGNEADAQDGAEPNQGSTEEITITGPIDQSEEKTEGVIYAFALMDNERIFKGEGTSAKAIAEGHKLNIDDNKLALVQCVQVSETEWEMYVLNMDSISTWFDESYQNLAKEQFLKWTRGEDTDDDDQGGGGPGGSKGPPAGEGSGSGGQN